jgi:hypothetical protein
VLIGVEPRPGAQEIEENAKDIVLDPVGGGDARHILTFAAHPLGQLHVERV